MRKGPVTGKQADKCGRCGHMRRYHWGIGGVSPGFQGFCSRCHGFETTGGRVEKMSHHRFVEVGEAWEPKKD